MKTKIRKLELPKEDCIYVGVMVDGKMYCRYIRPKNIFDKKETIATCDLLKECLTRTIKKHKETNGPKS